jgi:hypothetical protein
VLDGFAGARVGAGRFLREAQDATRASRHRRRFLGFIGLFWTSSDRCRQLARAVPECIDMVAERSKVSFDPACSNHPASTIEPAFEAGPGVCTVSPFRGVTSPPTVHRTVGCRLRFCAVALMVFATATSAGAAYRIETLFSDQTGEVQYIELRENDANGKVAPLAGSIISVKHGDIVKRYVIPSDPPQGFPAGASLILSTVADWSSDAFGPEPPLPPDYVVPVRFLPTNGGTIDLDGYDAWTFGALPVDGSTALLRSGATAPATGSSFALGRFSVHADFVPVAEYYNAALDHYFITGSEPDIDAIESGRITGWRLTGYWLGAFALPHPIHCCSTYGQTAVPVCRYYIPPALGDSHFFSAFVDECIEVAAKFPALVLENAAAFYVYLPNKDTGDCPRPFRPVYRLWNRRMDSGHRYIYDSLERRSAMLQQGWIAEGYGPVGVAWCI